MAVVEHNDNMNDSNSNSWKTPRDKDGETKWKDVNWGFIWKPRWQTHIEGIKETHNIIFLLYSPSILFAPLQLHCAGNESTWILRAHRRGAIIIVYRCHSPDKYLISWWMSLHSELVQSLLFRILSVLIRNKVQLFHLHRNSTKKTVFTQRVGRWRWWRKSPECVCVCACVCVRVCVLGQIVYRPRAAGQ